MLDLQVCRASFAIMKTALLDDFKADANSIIGSLAEDPTVVITDQDQATAYLIEAAEHEAQRDRLRILEGIARGEQALADGQVVGHEEARTCLTKWLD